MDLFTDMQGNILLAFGVCLMFGVMGGMMANRISWMPTITGFMLLGLVIGPHGLGLISKTMLSEAVVFIDIALGLILYKLGNMLHPRAMLKSRRLMTVAVLESVLSFVMVFAAGLYLGLETVVAAAVAAIGVSSSPSVLVHVSEELRAKGPITDRAKSLVAINNLIAFFLFSAVLPFGLVGGEQGLIEAIFVPLYRLAGAVVAGIAVAYLAIRVTRLLRPQDEHYRFAIVIGAVMLTMGLCRMIGASALFAPLILGKATRWFETRQHNLSKVGLGEGGDLFFIVLFVMAGAKINLPELWLLGIIPLVLALVRMFAKTAGIYAAGMMTGTDTRQSAALSMMLIPMAGMAIGLVTATNRIAPDLGGKIATMIFSMVAFFETIGPFLVIHALRMTGEAGKQVETLQEKEEEPVL